MFKLLFLFATVALSFNAFTASAEVVKERRDVGNFTKVAISGAVNVYLTQAKELSVFIEGEKEAIDAVSTEVAKGTLVIKPNESRNGKVSLYISMPTVEELVISSASKLEIKNDITCKGDFSITCSGASKISGKKIECKDLITTMSGASKCQLSFDAKNTKLTLSGASSGEFEVESKSLSANISGASKCKVALKTDDLNVKLSSASKMNVSGKTEMITANVDGASRLNVTELSYKKSNLNSTSASKIAMK